MDFEFSSLLFSILYSNFNEGKAEQYRFNTKHQTEPAGYPISQYKDEIYKEKAPADDIDVLYEWGVVTEKPKAVLKKSKFSVYKR